LQTANRLPEPADRKIERGFCFRICVSKSPDKLIVAAASAQGQRNHLFEREEELMNLPNRRSFGAARKQLCLVIGCASLVSASFSLAQPPAPTIHETRTYSHPHPAADKVMYPIVDISSKYVGVLGFKWRQINNDASHFDAFIFDAVTGQHLWTLTQPVPPDNVNFRFASLAIDGDLAVIGATYEHVPLPNGGVAPNAGAAYVYDLTTGQLKHKLVSNTPQNHSLLGSSVDILSDHIVVGSWGSAYVFDANSGDQLAQLNPSTPSNQFGISVAISESAILAGSNSDDSRGSFTGAVFAFNPQTSRSSPNLCPTMSPLMTTLESQSPSTVPMQLPAAEQVPTSSMQPQAPNCEHWTCPTTQQLFRIPSISRARRLCWATLSCET
jgi:hypothetical protein